MVKKLIYERHRHSYEFNNEYREPFEKAGMIFSGVSPDNHLVEIIELKGPSVFHRMPVPFGIRIPSNTSATIIP